MINLAQIVKTASLIEGWMAPEELSWLASTASKCSTIIEVGSWKGRSTKALAMATPGLVYAIDTWEGSKFNYPRVTRDEVKKYGSAAIFNIFQKNLAPEIQEHKLIPLHADSNNPDDVRKIKDLLGEKKAEMIFIDADHSYQCVKQDILNFLPLLAEKGIISGHDYAFAYPGVVQAVDEIFGTKIPKHATIWYCQK